MLPKKPKFLCHCFSRLDLKCRVWLVCVTQVLVVPRLPRSSIDGQPMRGFLRGLCARTVTAPPAELEEAATVTRELLRVIRPMIHSESSL